MDKPPISLAFIMVKDGFVIAAILFYLSSGANEDRGGGGTLSYYNMNRTPLLELGIWTPLEIRTENLADLRQPWLSSPKDHI